MLKKWLPVIVPVAAFVLLIVGVVIPNTQKVTHGYISYHTANRMFLTGEWTPQAYDDRWFTALILTITHGEIEEILTPNFPSAAYMLFPWGILPPEQARGFWIWENVGFLLLGLAFLLGNRNSPLQPWHGYFLGFALLFTPVVVNFDYGQGMIMTFCFLSVASYGLVFAQNKLAGIPMGMIFAFKGYGAALWLIPFFRRNWKTLLWAGGTFLALAISTLPWAGVESWVGMVISVRDLSNAAKLGVTAFQSTSSFLAHFFLADPVWNPNPPWNIPWVAAIVPGVVSLLALGVSLWNTQKANLRLAIAAILPLNTLLIPNPLEHHFILFLIPIFFLLEDVLQYPPAKGWRSPEWWLLIAGMLAVGLPWPYKHALFSEGWLSLLAYPRFYGGWMIWVAAIIRTRKGVSDVDSSRVR